MTDTKLLDALRVVIREHADATISLFETLAGACNQQGGHPPAALLKALQEKLDAVNPNSIDAALIKRAIVAIGGENPDGSTPHWFRGVIDGGQPPKE